MVLPLGPGKFYGRSLPRPRIYTDVKFSDDRVDPPVSVSDPLLSWANEAHWSMGGLSLNRLRLQGKIEGNVAKLSKEQEKISTPVLESKGKMKRGRKMVDSPSPPPVSRKLRLRSRVVPRDVSEDEGEGEAVEGGAGGVRRKRRRLVRKLGDDFETVANSPLKEAVSGRVTRSARLKTRGRRVMVLNYQEGESDNDDDDGLIGKDKNDVAGNADAEKCNEGKDGEKGSVSPNGTRSSPRLKNQKN